MLKAVADGWVVAACARWEGSHGNSSFQSYHLSLSAARWVRVTANHILGRFFSAFVAMGIGVFRGFVF